MPCQYLIGAVTLRTKALSITTFSIMTISIKAYFVTLSINETDHNQHSE
jgi:hypothetical protein